MKYEQAFQEFQGASAVIGVPKALSVVGHEEASQSIQLLPEKYQEDVANYVFYGQEPKCDLVRYVIENNLSGAIGYVNAREWSTSGLCDISHLTMFFLTRVPVGCAGGRNTRIDWQAAGGVMGQKS